MTKQFEDVSSRYGAPMGRRESRSIDTSAPRSVRLFRVRLGADGYDDGGAYWGTGAPLWCAEDDDGNRQFIRAGTRERAALELNIPNPALKRPLPGKGLAYGFAVLDGRAPFPGNGHTRESVIEWLRRSGAAMG